MNEEKRPSIAELIEELRLIQEIETAEIVISDRKNSPNPMETTKNEMAL